MGVGGVWQWITISLINTAVIITPANNRRRWSYGFDGRRKCSVAGQQLPNSILSHCEIREKRQITCLNQFITILSLSHRFRYEA